ncbi:MAG: DNA-processing protein DprA [Saprospiraceae bacterium]|nr:DNA-processing protein DprA [Saprospiraceae bacterium]
MQKELLYRIALSFIPKLGNQTIKKSLDYFGSAEYIFEQATKKELQAAKFKRNWTEAVAQKTTLNRAEKELKFIDQYKIQPLPYESSKYPQRLKNCHDAPHLLYYKGNSNLNTARIVSIVGTRKPTTRGIICCEQLIDDLKTYDVLITSGLAYGVDITAHKRSLKNNIDTVGVVAHGLDQIYPIKHRKTAQEMVKQGGILSEFTSGMEPLQSNFPMRNRIIAGMADAIVVIETAKKGGSMITAYLANEYNKDVFAVPGRTEDSNSKGCNHLIKTHRAALLESAEDIAYIMGWQRKKDSSIQKRLFIELNKQEQKITNLLVGQDPVHMEDLILQTQMSTSKIATLLLELELKGIVKALPGNYFRLL